ncbi:hypothetical protein GUJ93_ZPchr0003g17548 [Zizania palustris]|uniref:Uncharacterized protein n=1 Tax=Zizania palustris TaxID=103762 RepID=A0A8J5S8P1_ZIZPA|nr:hypothetical protein GUJ93_ZPchr0003g17548 [Zizania palustris]
MQLQVTDFTKPLRREKVVTLDYDVHLFCVTTEASPKICSSDFSPHCHIKIQKAGSDQVSQQQNIRWTDSGPSSRRQSAYNSGS